MGGSQSSDAKPPTPAHIDSNGNLSTEFSSAFLNNDDNDIDAAIYELLNVSLTDAHPEYTGNYSGYNASIMTTNTTVVGGNFTVLLAPSSSSNAALLSTVAYSIVLPIVAILGLVGNVANLITLASPRLRQVSYMYLRALAVADLTCMISVIVFTSIHTLKTLKLAELNGYIAMFYQVHLMLTLINFSVSAGILVVVALTVERYISVCFPIMFRQWNNPRRATMAILLAYLIPFVLYIPYGCFRYAMVLKGNDTHYYYAKADSQWKKDGDLYGLYEGSREVLLKIVPIVTLSVLNIQIMIAFRQRMQNRARLKNSGRTASTVVHTQPHMSNANSVTTTTNALPTSTASSVRNAINRLSKTDSNKTSDSGVKDRAAQRDDALLFLLAAIVLMFFICNIPAAVNLYLITEDAKSVFWYAVFRACANLLEIANHALNFYVFCMCSSEYRATFVEKFPNVHRTYRHLKRTRRRMIASILGLGRHDTTSNTNSVLLAGGGTTHPTAMSEVSSATIGTTGYPTVGNSSCAMAPSGRNSTTMWHGAGGMVDGGRSGSHGAMDLDSLSSEQMPTRTTISRLTAERDSLGGSNTTSGKSGILAGRKHHPNNDASGKRNSADGDLEPTEADQLLGGSRETFSGGSNILGDIQFMGDSDDDTML